MREPSEEKEIFLNVKQFPQPYPVKNQGGDCFACAFTAAFKHLFPEKDILFDNVFDYFKTTYYNSDKECLDNCWCGYTRMLNNAINDGLNIEYKTDIIYPDFSETNRFPYSWFKFNVRSKMFEKIFNLLSEKNLLIFTIDNGGRGPVYYDFNDNRYYNNSTNHLVLVDGIKSCWEPIENLDNDCKAFHYYIHVVCSAKGCYWVKLDDFIDKYGAAAWWQIRRNDNE